MPEAEDLFTPLASYPTAKGTPWWDSLSFTPYKDKYGDKIVYARPYYTKRGLFFRTKVIDV